MTLQAARQNLFAYVAAAVLATCMFAFLAPDQAFAVTAAEKQAEADAVYAQIDALQTSLNEAQTKYDDAVAERDEALAKRDEAQKREQEAEERISQLQEDLSAYAVANYKHDQATFLDVLLSTKSFTEFMTSYDAISAINKQGKEMITESRKARQEAAEARKEFEEQGKLAEERMKEAESTKIQIANTQDALRQEAAKLTKEAAELAAKEELEAEEARQAERARKAREEALSLAASQAGATGGQAGASVNMGSGYFCNPCPAATNSSGFGYRTFDNSFHKGLDMAAPSGTPYYAADSGTVIYATNDGGYNGGAGNWVVISHGNGIVTKYMHSSATYVKPGEQVERGQNIGAVGETGAAFGAHLHFQVEVDGVAVNPLNYI